MLCTKYVLHLLAHTDYVLCLLSMQEGWNCLHHAVDGGNLTLVNELITQHGCDPRKATLVSI